MKAMFAISSGFHKLAKATCWLFVYLVMSHGLPSALVICLGDNDHAAVEKQHTSSESKEHGGAHADFPLVASHDEQPFVSDLGPAPQGIFSVLTAYLPSLQTSVDISHPGILPRHLSPPVSYLASLQTVLLLI